MTASRSEGSVLTLLVVVAAGACGRFGEATPDVGPDGGDAAVAAETSAPKKDGGCNGEPSCTRVVFVSATTTNGALGGPTGGDSLCNEDAIAGASRVKGRTFVAWLSASAQSASSRHVQGTGPYVLMDGTLVAKDWMQLVSGSLVHAIDQEPDGTTVGPDAVWTGTGPAGEATSNTCMDWMSDNGGVDGTLGDTKATNGEWTRKTLQSCNSPERIFCIER